MNLVRGIASRQPRARRMRWCLILLWALFCPAVTPMVRADEPTRPRRVLMVHSFGSSAPPFTTHSTAFEAMIKRELGARVDLDEVSLDMARYADMEDAFADFLSKRLAKWQPDLVVPIGSPAGRFVAKFRGRLFPDTPVVFSGMDKRTLPDGASTANATFVGEDFDLKGLVEDILQLDPQTKQVVVIIGATPLEKYWTAAFRDAFEPFAGRVKFTWVNEMSFEQMQDLVSKLPPHSFVLLGLLIRDAAGVTYNEDEALQRLHAVSSAPISGLYQNEVGLGVIGGRLYQGELEGEESARVAVRVLRGEPIASIPPQIIGTRAPLYDWRELNRWGIGEDRLPPGSVVLFRQPTTWQRYRWWILGTLLVISLQGLTILALLTQRAFRRRAQAALAENRELMELATGAGEMGLWSRDSSDGKVWMNGPMRKLFGFDEKVAVSFEDILARVHPDDRSRMVCELSRSHEQNAPFEGEFRLHLQDGAERWLLGKGRSVIGPGGASHRMGAVLDITARKNAEAELRRNRDELTHLSRVTTMGELAASLAHELNQPLAAMLSNAQAARRFLAQHPTEPGELREILEDIVAENRRACEIILRMRQMTRKDPPVMVTLDLEEVINEVVSFVHGDAKKFRLSVEVDPDLPLARGVKVQVQQVLLNLLLNAIAAVKEMPPDRRTISVKAEADGQSMIRVTVTDRGPGLTAGILEEIFKPFFTTKQDGLGMGLPISRSIIETHGGKLWAQNNPTGGASFCFTLCAELPLQGQADHSQAQTVAQAGT